MKIINCNSNFKSYESLESSVDPSIGYKLIEFVFYDSDLMKSFIEYLRSKMEIEIEIYNDFNSHDLTNRLGIDCKFSMVLLVKITPDKFEIIKHYLLDFLTETNSILQAY